MSTIRRRDKSWEAQVFRQGQGVPEVCFVQNQSRDVDLVASDGFGDSGRGGPLDQVPGYPFSKLLERYRDEVTVHKRGQKKRACG
jgi:hypothetical protein